MEDDKEQRKKKITPRSAGYTASSSVKKTVDSIRALRSDATHFAVSSAVRLSTAGHAAKRVDLPRLGNGLTVRS